MRTGLLLLAIALCSIRCSSDNPVTEGKLQLNFTYRVSDQTLTRNALIYTNTAGNIYEVSEIQWFISDLSLVGREGSIVPVPIASGAYYIDSNLPSTQTCLIPSSIRAAEYSAITFTFGLRGENNIPGQFPDPPEAGMQWPYTLGGDQGGYHYMKLNGFWLNEVNQREPFNFHFGVGQRYNEDGEVTEYIQNWFKVTLPVSFRVHDRGTSTIEIRMDIDKWFGGSIVYDHNTFGGMIMKNQEAMSIIRVNGAYVFSAHASQP